MKLLIDVAGAKHQKMYEANSNPNYLAHEDEPQDLFIGRENRYLLQRKDNNRPSLFEDSDITFNYWFCVARQFLRNH